MMSRKAFGADQTYSATSSTAWYTTGNWVGNAFPGAQGAATTNNDTANIGSQFSGTTLGINFTTNSLNLGMISVSGNRTTVLNIGDSGATAGSLRLYGNSTGVILSNVGSNTLNLQAAQNGIMTLAINNPVDNFVVLDNAANISITANMTGSGNLVLNAGLSSTGNLILAATNTTFSGNIVLNSGRLRLDNQGAISTSSNLTVKGSSLLNFNAAGTYGGVTKVLTLNATQTATAAVTSLTGQTVTWAGNVSLLTDSRIEPVGSGILSFTGNLSGSGTLIKAGTGNLSLTGTTNTATGGTTIISGNISVGAGSKLGTGNLTMAQNLGNNTQLILNNATQSIANLSSSWGNTTGTQTQTIRLNGTALTINQANDLSYGNGSVSTLVGNITGSGSIVKAGSAKLTLLSANDYQGGTTVSAGTLEVAHAGALGTGNVAVTGGLLSSTVVSVGGSGAGGATLSGSGNLTLNSTSSGNLTLGTAKNFILTGGTWNVSITSTSSYDQIVGSSGGNFSLTGGNIALSGFSFSASDSFLLFKSFGTTTNVVSGVTIYTGNGLVGSIDATTGLLTFTDPNATGRFWVGDDSTRGGAGTWTQTGGNAWATSDADVVGGEWNTGNTTANFGGSTGADGTVTVSDTVATGKGMTFTGNYTLSSGTIALAGDTLANNTISVADSKSAVIGSALTGTVGLSKTGNGTLTLGGNNSGLSGNVSITAGTVALASSNALNSGTSVVFTGNTGVMQVAAASVTIKDLFATAGTNPAIEAGVGSPVQLDVDGNGTFNGILRNGTGFLIIRKTGAGTTLNLTGANSYTGGTYIASGTLNTSNSAALGTGDLSVTGGSLTTGTSQLTLASGNIYMDSGSIALNGASTGNITLGSSKTVDLQGGNWSLSISSLSSYDQIVSAGSSSFTLNGVTLDLTGAVAGSYQILSGFTSGTVTSYSVNGTLLASSIDNTGLLTLSVVGRYWVGDDTTRGGDGTWSSTGGTSWAISDANVAGTSWNPIYTAMFGGATGGTVTVSDAVTVGNGISFNTTGYTVTGNSLAISGNVSVLTDGAATINSAITGSGFIKAGNGTLTLGGDNSGISGNVTIAAGNVTLASANALGSGSSLVFSGNTGLVQLAGNSVSIGSLNATGTLPVIENANAGCATLTITGNGTYTGVLRDGTGGGNLSVSKTGSGTIIASGIKSYTGDTSVSTGNFTVTNTGITAGKTLTVDSGGVFNQVGVSSTFTGAATLVNGTISGGNITASAYNVQSGTISSNLIAASAVLAKTTGGDVTVSGTNTFTGGVTIDDGNLIVGSAGALNAAGTNAVTMTGGTLSVNGKDVTINGLSGTSGTVIQNNASSVGNLTVNVTGTHTFAGNIVDGNAGGKLQLNKAGAGTLVLSGDNTYSGNTSISAGTVRANSGSAAFGSGGTIKMTGGSLLVSPVGGAVENKIEIGGAGASSNTNFTDLSWNFGTSSGTAAPTATAGVTGFTISNVTKGNDSGNPSTALLSSASASSGYSGASGGFNVETTTNGGTFNSGTSAYFEFTLTPTTATSITITDLSFGSRSTSTGPLGYTVRATSSLGTDLGSGTMTANSAYALQGGSSFPDLTITAATTFRIYAFNGTGSTGAANWRLDDLKLLGFSSVNAASSGNGTIGTDEAGLATISSDILINSEAILTATLATSTSEFGGAITGVGMVTKTGLGNVTITSNLNTYTGNTTVTAGRLAVNNTSGSATGTGTVTVKSGATLGGNGTISGTVTVQSGGTLAAGNSVGTLHTGNLTLAGKLSVDVDVPVDPMVQGGAADEVIVTGAVNVSGASLEFILNPAHTYGDADLTYVLIDNDLSDAIVGSFTGLTRGGALDSAAFSYFNLKGTLYYSYDSTTSSTTGGNDLAIHFSSVPEPTSLSMVGLGLGGLLARRRRRNKRAVSIA